MDKEELVDFGMHPLPGSDPGIFKDPSTLRDREFFHNVSDISRQTDRIFKCTLNEEVRVKFWIHIRIPDPDHADSPWIEV